MILMMNGFMHENIHSFRVYTEVCSEHLYPLLLSWLYRPVPTVVVSGAAVVVGAAVVEGGAVVVGGGGGGGGAKHPLLTPMVMATATNLRASQ